MTPMHRILTDNGNYGQFVRFILVGLVNTAVGYGIFAVLVLVAIPAQIALVIAFVLGVFWNFATHARLVFGKTGFSRLPAYGAVYCGIWAVNAVFLAATHRLGVGPLAAQAGLAPLAAVLSYFMIARVLTGKFPVFGAGKS